MIVVFNLLAVLFIAVVFAVFWLVSWIGSKLDINSKVAEGVGLFLGLSVAFGLDLAYRWRNRQEEEDPVERFIYPSRGGALMLLPIWLYAFLGLGVVTLLLIFQR